MKFEGRIFKLEREMQGKYSSPETEKELAEWLKANPDYNALAQSDNGVEMPPHLEEALMLQTKRIFEERGVDLNGANLLNLLEQGVFLPGLTGRFRI